MAPDPSSEAYLDEPGFQSLLVSCLEKLERGESLDRGEILQRHPEYAQPLEAFLEDLQLLRRVAGGVRDSLAGGGGAPPGQRGVEETIDSNPHREALAVGDRIRYIGDYEILEEIARGGMGVVFKARQKTLGRDVALKVILSGRLADEADVERFQREARAAGRLRHPNIVPVHEIGLHDGHHFFTMDFVQGRSLSEMIRDESLSPRYAAELIRTTAQAVQFAHRNDTLHRDLKPANILIDAEGQPHITDFGLAKFTSDDDPASAELTASGQILGTPSYMSPEQAQGRQSHIGPATDIYSLGAVLYAALTGRAPFVADTPLDTLLQVIRNEPVAPRALNPKVPRDLETICLKCLEKEPHKRYGTPELLAEDLGRFLEGRPVSARPVGMPTKVWRWTRRNPVVASLLLLSALLLLAGTAVSTVFAILANERAAAEGLARGRANRQAALARQAEQSARQALLKEEQARHDEQAMRSLAEERLEARTRSLFALQLTRAHSIWKDSPAEAANLLQDEDACPPRLRGFGWRYVQYLTDRRLESWPTDIESVRSTADRLRAVDVSPDGTLIAAVGRGTTAFVWRRGESEPVAELGGQEVISTVAFSADGRRLATVSGVNLTVWNIATAEVQHRLQHGGRVRRAAFSPDGRVLVSAGQGVVVWDAESGDLLRRLGDADDSISHLVVSADSKNLLTASTKGDIVLWSMDASAPIRTVHRVDPPKGTLDIGGRVRCLDWSQDGARYLFADALFVHVCDLESGAEICQVRDDVFSTQAEWMVARFSPNGRWIVTSSGTHPTKLWDATSGAEEFALTPHKAAGDFRFSDDGRSLLSGDGAGNAVLWRVPDATGSYSINAKGIRTSISSADGLLAIYGKADLTVLRRASHPPLWSQGKMRLRRAAFSPAGDVIAGLLDGGEVRLWAAADGEEIAAYDNQARGEALVFLDDSRLAFSSGRSGVTIWNRHTDESFTLESGGRGVLCLAVSPDGRRLAAGHGIHPLPDGTPPGKLVVWDIAGRRQLATLKGHDQFGVYDVAFSPDGKLLASCGGGVVLWDAATFEQKYAITAHTAPIWSGAFAPDGLSFATASMDATVRLWDPKSGEQRLLLSAHPSWVTSVEFSPDGRHLFSAGAGGEVRWWPAGEIVGD
ncbi:MAG: protein kinase [Pirellulaceae bacterium]